MMDGLGDFLRAASRRDFSWGDHDCCMWLADWVALRRGADPAAGWRGRYTTPLGAARIIKRRGGLVAHLEGCLAPLGIERTDEPGRGDIAVVGAAEGDCGAIVIGSTVALVPLLQPGIIVRPRSVAPIIAAWNVGHAVKG
jgi:hypothetical protein